MKIATPHRARHTDVQRLIAQGHTAEFCLRLLRERQARRNRSLAAGARLSGEVGAGPLPGRRLPGSAAIGRST
jgi:hypothetical protein